MSPRPRRQHRSEWDLDRALLDQAAHTLRHQSRQQEAESKVDRAPIVPADRWVVVGLLEELASDAGRGDLTPGTRRVALELARALLKDAEHDHS